jgi:release factor glutamine methyltransferase
MAFILNKHFKLSSSALITNENMELSAAAYDEWKFLEARRLLGEPVAYLIGEKGFYNINLKVGPGVLIPRPETELLVEIGCIEIKRIEDEKGVANVLDLGTGSGAIALAIAYESPNAIVVATDQSPDALMIANVNAKHLNLENHIRFFQGDWYEALEENLLFDVILSNPPYIAILDPHLTKGDLRFEPITALTDNANGLTHLEVIVKKSLEYLKPLGLIAVEHGFDQSETVAIFMKNAGLHDIQNHKDLAGHYRVTSGRKNSLTKQ